jgi:hypothetical protein
MDSSGEMLLALSEREAHYILAVSRNASNVFDWIPPGEFLYNSAS